MHYPLTYSTFEEEEKKALYEVVESNRFTMGTKVEAFENVFSKFFNKKYATMVNSGSSANLIAVASLFYREKNPLKPGDEVIVPCISWATTYYPLHQYGLKLKFVDVDLETLNIDPEEIKKAITPKTRMLVAVSVLGNPCYFDKLMQICTDNNLIFFEDNCESMGAEYNGRYTGTFGDINTFSTFFSHHISTIEGGIILTDNHELYCLCKSLRNHGWTRDQDQDSTIFKRKNDDFFEAYRFILPGYNVRPGEINGALGLSQIEKLSKYLEIRRKNAEYFCELFANDDRFIIQKEVGKSSWFSFTMIVSPEYKIKRSNVLNHLKKSNIDHRIITGGNFLQHDVKKHINYEATKTTNADIAHFNGFFVGNAPIDLRREIDHLFKSLKEV